MSSTVLTEKTGHVLQITLNRPEAYNAFNRDMALALQEAMQLAEDDQDIRAVLLTGSGKAFYSFTWLLILDLGFAPRLSLTD